MPTNTANLNLFKYGSTDGARTFNIDEALNANWDKIDEAVAKKYTKAPTGIPELDLDSAVKAALGKARTALQSVTKADVGLGNVDNTSDANKPVSTAQQTALNLKANIASPTFTGTPKSTTAAAGTNTTQIATTAFVKTAVDNSATTINDSIATHKADNVSHDTYVTCATDSATAEKVVTANDFTLVEGARITVKFANANTATTPTLKINTELAKPLVKADGTAFKNIKAGIYSFVYSGASFTLLGEGGEYGTATANDVVAGKTFGTEDGIVTGTATIETLGGIPKVLYPTWRLPEDTEHKEYYEVDRENDVLYMQKNDISTIRRYDNTVIRNLSASSEVVGLYKEYYVRYVGLVVSFYRHDDTLIFSFTFKTPIQNPVNSNYSICMYNDVIIISERAGVSTINIYYYSKQGMLLSSKSISASMNNMRFPKITMNYYKVPMMYGSSGDTLGTMRVLSGVIKDYNSITLTSVVSFYNFFEQFMKMTSDYFSK